MLRENLYMASHLSYAILTAEWKKSNLLIHSPEHPKGHLENKVVIIRKHLPLIYILPWTRSITSPEMQI